MLDNERAEDSDKRSLDVHEEYRRTRRNAMIWLGLTALAPFALGPNACESFGLPASDVDLPAAIVFYALAVISIFNLLSHFRADIYLRRANGPDLFQENWRTADELMDKVAKRAVALDQSLQVTESNISQSEKHLVERIENVRQAIDRRSQELSIPDGDLDFSLDRLERYARRAGSLDRVENPDEDTKLSLNEAEMHISDAKGEAKDFLHSRIQILKSKLDQVLQTERPLTLDESNRDRVVIAVENLIETRSGLRKFHDDIRRSDRGFYFGLDVVPLLALTLFAAANSTIQFLEFESWGVSCSANDQTALPNGSR